MQKIINDSLPCEILVDSLSGTELVAYRSHNSEGVCVLSKLNKGNTYGFVRLSNSISAPVFVGEGWYGSVHLAAKARQLYAFENMEELLISILNNKF